jgi:hypothetical protein
VGLESETPTTNGSDVSTDKASDLAGRQERDTDEPDNTTTVNSLRRKSLLLRERIAAGKSPGLVSPGISNDATPVNSTAGLELEKPTTNGSNFSADKNSDSAGRRHERDR